MYRKDCSIDAKQKWYTISNANVFFIVANTQSDYEILNFVPPNFTISITYIYFKFANVYYENVLISL